MTPDPVADAIEALVRAQKRNGFHDTQWTPIKASTCCLCGRTGRQSVVANLPQQAPEKGVHMAAHLAAQLDAMSSGKASAIDRSVLGHAAWMLRDLLDRETRALDISQQHTARWRVHA